MKFTVVIDTDTSKEPTTPAAVYQELVSLLKGTKKDWRFKVWPPTETEDAQ